MFSVQLKRKEVIKMENEITINSKGKILTSSEEVLFDSEDFKTLSNKIYEVKDSLNHKIDNAMTDGHVIGIGWNGSTFTSKITSPTGVISNYRILRDLSTSNSVYGFGYDAGGLYFSVDSSKIYIQTR